MLNLKVECEGLIDPLRYSEFSIQNSALLRSLSAFYKSKTVTLGESANALKPTCVISRSISPLGRRDPPISDARPPRAAGSMATARPPSRSTRCASASAPGAPGVRQFAERVIEHDDVEGAGLVGQHGDRRMLGFDERPSRVAVSPARVALAASSSTTQARPEIPGFSARSATVFVSEPPMISNRSPSLTPVMATTSGSPGGDARNQGISLDDIVRTREKSAKIAEARGKLGILLVGMGAVSTTTIAGVIAIRRGLAKPIDRSRRWARSGLASARKAVLH